MRCIAVPDPALAAHPSFGEATLVLGSLAEVDEPLLRSLDGRPGRRRMRRYHAAMGRRVNFYLDDDLIEDLNQHTRVSPLSRSEIVAIVHPSKSAFWQLPSSVIMLPGR